MTSVAVVREDAGRRRPRGLAAALLLVPCCLAAESRFAPAADCALCHSKTAPPGAPGGASIAPYALWRGSMMANAARDPYWAAKARYEAASIPAAASAIEDKCLRCHAPMQQYESPGLRLAGLNDTGREGVSCTVCHQIERAGLGARESFTGGFRINAEHNIYGPHADPFPMPMLHHSGYFPKQGLHILESSLCGTCHTVITPTLAADGRATGEFIEQAPFLEWLASDYAKAGAGCQSCHVPPLRDEAGGLAAQHIAHMPNGRGTFPPTRPRAPFGRHFFSGANGRMLEALGNPGAPRAFEMLRSGLALELEAARRGARIEVVASLRNLAGHKLPTGFPSRRLWLHLQVRDGAGKTVFESGADAPPTGQPHWAEITRPGQVQVYESVMLDGDGRPTVQLMRAARFGKDNRLLPAGFDPALALPGGMTARAVGASGVSGDADFLPGADRVLYRIDPGAAPGPFRILVEARYQTLSSEYAQPLGGEFLHVRERLLAPATAARKEMSLAALR